MIKQRELAAEVTELIESGIEAGLTMDAKWIAEELVQRRHQGDQDFLELCANAHIRDTVRECLRAYKDSPDPATDQLKLPGFEFLQKAYLIEREKQQVIVPIDKCSNEEILEKIQTYRKMAQGCVRHANELERYRQQQFGAQ